MYQSKPNGTIQRAKPTADNQCPNCALPYTKLGGDCVQCGLLLTVENFEQCAKRGQFEYPPAYLKKGR